MCAQIDAPRPAGRHLRTAGGTLALLLGIGLLGCASTTELGTGGQTTDETVVPSADAGLNERMPAGTQFDVRLQQALSTESNEAGDQWSAVVASDVTDGNRVLLQRGAVVTGEVTQAGPVEIEGEDHQMLALNPSQLQAAGQTYPIEAEVVAAEARESRDLFTGGNAAIVGGGALAGTLLGELLLDDALLGAVLGAAGGSAVAVARSDTQLELREGTILTLELERDVGPIS
jgi:hypothetical protein